MIKRKSPITPIEEFIRGLHKEMCRTYYPEESCLPFGLATPNNVQTLYNLAIDADEFDIAVAIDANDDFEIRSALKDWAKRHDVPRRTIECINDITWFNRNLNVIYC